MRSKCGNVLPLVLGLLLVLSILVTAMLKMPGALRRNVSLVAKETQEMYFAESAVLAKLNGFPDGYFAELPIVESRILGPWTEWSVLDKFQFMLGSEYGRFSTSEWARCAVVLEQNLHERILHSDGLKNLSGNRRFFKLDSSDGLSAERTMAINVSAGDLTLDLGESRAFDNSQSSCKSIRSFMANVEGDVKIRGNVHFDTLRIYATGSVSVQGNVAADFVEIFGLASVTVSGNVSLAGMLLSKQNIEISDRAQMKFPSVALAVGYRENRLSLLEKSVFEGLAIAPSGTVERDSSAKLLDSTQVLLPFCMETRNLVFSRRRL
jgi:cytoskeletal protein CcmA (bactofilin family)